MGRVRNMPAAGYWIIAALMIACSLGLAWVNRFTQDDAFISLRYARNLAEGHGLVWNIGERVEGYTNFLWVLLMTVPFLVGVEPVLFSYVAGLAIFAVSLVLFYRLSRLVFDCSGLGLVALLVLGTNYTFIAYATGGMETQLQACLFVASLYLTVGGMKSAEWGTVRVLGLSLVLAGAVMTRMDSFILVAVTVPAVLCDLWQSAIPGRRKAALVLWLAVPFGIVVGGWLVWKLSYYGDIFPNTFYAKGGSPELLAHGVKYLYLFCRSYLLMVFPVLLLTCLSRLVQSAQREALLPAVMLVGLWVCYIVAVGGDFMEFRFIVPILPAIVILLVWLACVHIQQPTVSVGLLLLILLGSAHHARTFHWDGSIETVRMLRGRLESPERDWDGVGRRLGEVFDHSKSVTIAVTAAGAIPFYSSLPSVDMMGLNDRWVARHGLQVDTRPGHRLRAPISYLMQREVNLAIGHPQFRPLEEPFKLPLSLEELELFQAHYTLTGPMRSLDELPAGATVVAIPYDAKRCVPALYLTPSEVVDREIAAGQWQTYPVHAP